MGKVFIGVSACLLGEKVRYDGRDKYDPFVAETLAKTFELVAVCPEVELGLGTPREPIQLEGDPESPRLMGIESRKDLTEPMREWSERRFQTLENLSGFVFKSKSPSCGLRANIGETFARGIFAWAFTERFPEVPFVEAKELHDFELRENFIKRVLALRRQ